MEIRETVRHSFHPLKNGWFIDEVEVGRTSDYWLGNTESEERTYLANEYGEARKYSLRHGFVK